VASFLQRGRKLRRRFREETVTDLLMSSLIAYGGGRLIVEFPDEPVTGADMQWDFVNLDRRSFFRIMIQAKQLYGDGGKWSRHNYTQMYHRPKVGGLTQAATYLYIFYNPSNSCKLAADKGVNNIEGINLSAPEAPRAGSMRPPGQSFPPRT
jgi:hypothetical protein